MGGMDGEAANATVGGGVTVVRGLQSNLLNEKVG